MMSQSDEESRYMPEGDPVTLRTKNGDVALKPVMVIGGTMMIFFLGCTFWAGAAYNRLSSIESHMSSIDSKISDYGTLSERVTQHSRDLDRLQDKVRDLELRSISEGKK